MKRSLPLVLLAAAALVAGPLWACSVPVFRYALERWPADPYDVVVFHRGPLSEEQQGLVEELIPVELDGQGVANIRVQVVDLDGGPSEAHFELWERQSTDTLPWMAVRHRTAMRSWIDVWSGPFEAATVERLIDSPLRQEVARQLLTGTSVVWVLLESGDREKDDAAAEVLAQRIEELQDQMQLPDVDEADIAEGLLDIAPSELKLQFSMVRLSRDDPDEQLLVEMLLATEDDLREFDEPMALPVFGRGRVLYALVGAGINDDTIERASYELIGPCTCQVKDENPGTDLLMAVDWDRLVVPTSVDDDRPLPPLPGLPDLTVHDEPEGLDAPLDGSSPRDEGTSEQPAIAVAVDSDSAPPRSSGMLWNTVLIAGAGFLVVVAGSVLLVSRRGKSVASH